MALKNILKLALVQMPIATLQVEENLARGEAMIAQAAESGAEMVILPELWTTGFNWPRNLKIAKDHIFVAERVAALAMRYKVWIYGSLLSESAKGEVTNAGQLFSPEGPVVARYNKVHLFTMSGEDRYLKSGDKAVCAATPWGPVGLTICYDIRFPELWRTLALAGARLILCPAGVPNPRQPHWRTLLHARAIENQCYVAGVNRIGVETIPGGPALSYFGNSQLVDPWGETLLEARDEEACLIKEIDLKTSDLVRQKMSVLKDRKPGAYWS